MSTFRQTGVYKTFQYDQYVITLVVTDEFVSRVTSRNPKISVLEWLVVEGVKEPLDLFIGMTGTHSIQATLNANKSRIFVPLVLERNRRNPYAITVKFKTVYVGDFIPYKDDYRFTFDKNPKVEVVFERDYEPELMAAVVDDLKERWPLEAPRGYHLKTDLIDYIAEVEPDLRILIPDAGWRRESYIFEFEV